MAHGRRSILDTWHGNESKLSASLPELVKDYECEVRPAVELVAYMVGDAGRVLNRAGASVQG